MTTINVGYALCGSFCSFSSSITQMKKLKEVGYNVIPIMSQNAYTINTRFGNAKDICKEIEDICGNEIIHTIEDAEPIGPQNMTDIMVICPCTGNTLAKLAQAITDTAVTMATKSHLRGGKPVLIALATNDALGATAQNLGKVMNTKHMYFIPLSQDNPLKKPNSLVADFELLLPALEKALARKQLEPVLF